MKIGAHVSAAGGLHNAPQNAAREGLECFQFFSRPPQGGPPPKIDDEKIELFRQACLDNGFEEYYIHTPYVLNICSSKPEVRKRSGKIIRTDLERASLLGCPSIMTHLGSANGLDHEKALKITAEEIKTLLGGYDGNARLLLEISAGAGNVIGSRFDELAEILDGIGDSRVGTCFDTAHAFASGYDLRTPEALRKTLDDFDQTIGLKRLELLHVNDSKIDLGEHKDRHEHLGQGFIGTDGFRALVSHIKLKDVNLILETPTDGRDKDIELLKQFRNLND